MSQIRRFWYALMVTMAIGVALIMYFRIGVDYLQPMLNGNHAGLVKGPFTDQGELVYYVVPVALSIILVSTWFWVLISPQQEETKRAQVGPPR